jgi:hypothetical protein
MGRLVVVAVLLVGCTSGPSSTRDMIAPPDLTTLPPDLAPRPTAGIACGPNQCAAGVELCCTSDRGVTGMCQRANMPSCGSAEFLCDAPDDCPPAMHECCVMGGFANCYQTGVCAQNGGTLMCNTVVDCPAAMNCCPAPNGSPYKLCLTTCP